MIDLPPCPNENEGSRHSWIMRAANIYAHRAIREAVYLITYKLTRAPSPYNEVDTSVRKAFAEAAEYAGRNGESIPQQQTCHTFNNSGDVDRAAKERAAKRAAWPELAAPSEQQRKSISELLVVAPEVIEALSGMDVLFCAESSEGPAIVIYATGIVRRRHRCGSTASHGRVPGNPRSSFQAANEDGPSASTRAHRPYSSQLARQGSFACSTFSWCADMEREVAAVALLDTAVPISPAAARHLFAGRKICVFFDMETRVASALLFVKLPTNIKAGADFSESTHAYAIVHPLRACAEDDFLVMSAALPIGMT